jgi:hypothetical protein
MKILIFAAAFVALASGALLRAAEPASADPKESILTFFRHLKDSLQQSAVSGERKKGRTSAVAAVRGKDQESSASNPDVPLLKGDRKSAKAKVARAEDAEFAKAVDLVLAGKRDEGVAALEAFKAKHPKTHKLDEVQRAIDEAKALPIEKADAKKP